MDNLKKMLGYLLNNSRKAVVGFIVTMFLGLVARIGIDLDISASASLASFLEALAVGLSVWLIGNKQ